MVSSEAIRENVADVRARIAESARRAGRSPEAIRLVVVTKMVGVEEARVVFEAGVRDLGENRIQEARRKMDALSDLDISWHMIGHLQTNKANKAAGAFHLVHSVDSLRLARALDGACRRKEAPAEVLVQVNVSAEETKAGFRPDGLGPALEELAGMSYLRISGLMTMAPFVDDPETVRPVFAALRELRDRHAGSAPAGVDLRHLSMGMTQDFEVAIEEGADIVRIGTALFRER